MQNTSVYLYMCLHAIIINQDVLWKLDKSCKKKSMSIALLRLKNDAPTVTLKILTKIITPVYEQLFPVFFSKVSNLLKIVCSKIHHAGNSANFLPVQQAPFFQRTSNEKLKTVRFTQS